MKKEKLPNQLTILRIFMIPVFLIVLYLPHGAAVGASYVSWIVAAIIFAVASITDWLDGYLRASGKLFLILVNLQIL